MSLKYMLPRLRKTRSPSASGRRDQQVQLAREIQIHQNARGADQALQPGCGRDVARDAVGGEPVGMRGGLTQHHHILEAVVVQITDEDLAEAPPGFAGNGSPRGEMRPGCWPASGSRSCPRPRSGCCGRRGCSRARRGEPWYLAASAPKAAAVASANVTGMPCGSGFRSFSGARAWVCLQRS